MPQAGDADWRYVLVRRYFAFLEHSLHGCIEWAVFEPSGEPLWARARASIEALLVEEFRDGALVGATPSEAFFVRCDRTTMTQADLDGGRLVCLVGVAVLRPAEFELITIAQLRASGGSAERNRFFEGQLLSVDDFEREQTYLRDKRWLHNRLVHGVGIVHGLDVAVDGGGGIVVEPGLALDPVGREVVVPDLHRVCVGELRDEPAVVALQYVEHETDHRTVREGYELRLGPSGAGAAGGVVLGTVRRRSDGALVVEPAVGERVPVSPTASLEARIASLEERITRLEGV